MVNVISKKDKILQHISSINFINNCELNEVDIWGSISGKFTVSFKELPEDLNFEVDIRGAYPFKNQGADSIRFINTDLIGYGHVMIDGSICIHTTYHHELKHKVRFDFNALKNWIIKYYINNEVDSNYEHLVVNEIYFNDHTCSYIFTNTDHKFKKDDYGLVHLNFLSDNHYKKKTISNFLVKSFSVNNDLGSEVIPCSWSEDYHNKDTTHLGFFYYLDHTPATHNKFIFENWSQLNPYISREFLKWLNEYQKSNNSELKNTWIPIFLGYPTINEEIHWAVAKLSIGNFPIIGEPEKMNGIKTGKWFSVLSDTEISWSIAHNSSYHYFFGRGKLCDEITNKNILIIGTGAIGSMIATTLVRGGARNISLADFDVKEPENVCRSEFFFDTGYSNKVIELKKILNSISPFANVKLLDDNYFDLIPKTYFGNGNSKQLLSAHLHEYDLIFDCSTDNDLMYVLDSLELNGDLINLSISNHAKELICGFYPNVHNFITTVFGSEINNDVNDLYEPTGCWDPTFKASYNDINSIVQFAVKHINQLYKDNKGKGSFIIKTEETPFLNFQLIQY